MEAPKTLEHWFNGIPNQVGRRDIYLRINPAGPLWEIEARHAGQVSLTEYGSERQARRILTNLLASGGWHRLKP
jgi:hypothetical protein